MTEILKNSTLVVGVGGAGLQILKKIPVGYKCDKLYIDSTESNSKPHNIKRSLKFRVLDIKKFNPLGDSETVVTIKEEICSYENIVLIGGLGGYTATKLLLNIATLSLPLDLMTTCIAIIPLNIERSRRSRAESTIEDHEILFPLILIDLEKEKESTSKLTTNLGDYFSKVDKKVISKVEESIGEGYISKKYYSINLVCKITEFYMQKGITKSKVEKITEIVTRFNIIAKARAYNIIGSFEVELHIPIDDMREINDKEMEFESHIKNDSSLLVSSPCYSIPDGIMTIYDPEIVISKRDLRI